MSCFRLIARRRFPRAVWLLASALVLLLPKCIACLLAYAAIGAGVEFCVVPPAATNIPWALAVTVSVASLGSVALGRRCWHCYRAARKNIFLGRESKSPPLTR